MIGIFTFSVFGATKPGIRPLGVGRAPAHRAVLRSPFPCPSQLASCRGASLALLSNHLNPWCRSPLFLLCGGCCDTLLRGSIPHLACGHGVEIKKALLIGRNASWESDIMAFPWVAAMIVCHGHVKRRKNWTPSIRLVDKTNLR